MEPTGLLLRPGVETLTIEGAVAGDHLRVESAGGTPIVTVVADEVGNAHIAVVPAAHGTIATIDDWADALATGDALAPGEYFVIDGADTRHGPARVLAIEDVSGQAFYEQPLEEGFGYLTVRDGVMLSAMVRFPNPDLYGEGPWPTVIEYSGYGPSNPDKPQPGTLLANLMGFAVVGVNMRGTGCSGGVFDVFSPAQAADGYDIVEIVARQPWVKFNKVGMVGLSYPGISQLYVAATRPPSLAAITPLSVIDDLWRQQWPGGTYNSGFTRAWLAQRDAETKVGGQSWDAARIAAGDEQAAANQAIRSQSFDFERFGRAIENFRPALEARRVERVLDRIEVPVYLTGAWQDEQTGSRFAQMLGRLHGAPHRVIALANGHHPDGYSPMFIHRWFEFLSFYVAREVPKVPDLIRTFAPLQFAEVFGYTTELEADRFDDVLDDYDAALLRYRNEPEVRLLFEVGAGGATAGATEPRGEISVDEFPPIGVESHRLYLAASGALAHGADAVQSAVRYRDDLDAGALCYAVIDELQDFTRPTVPVEWTYFDDDASAQFETSELNAPIVIAGSGHVDVCLIPGTEDTSVQATLTEIRPDGAEVRIQCGWHRPQHGVEDETRAGDLVAEYTYTPEHRSPLEPGAPISFRIPIMPVAHVVRAGSRLRLSLSTPGRDMPLWCFENPVREGATHQVLVGGASSSALVLPVWKIDAHDIVAESYPSPDALRGQPSRPARPVHNTVG